MVALVLIQVGLFNLIALPTGSREGCMVYALEDYSFWNIPWNVTEGRLDDLRHGGYMLLDHSADRRFGPTQAGDCREVWGVRFKVIGRTRDAFRWFQSGYLPDSRQTSGHRRRGWLWLGRHHDPRCPPGARIQNLNPHGRNNS